MRIEQFKHVIFDMDGVLLDSNSMKIDAARATFAAVEPTLADRFAEHFRRNFGLTRQRHFSWGYEQLLQPLGHAPEIVPRMVDDYAARVSLRYQSCAVAQGAEALLRRLSASQYVLTGSDEKEARAVLQEKGLASHFIEILGSPASKQDNMRQLLRDHAMDTQQTVLIGDSSHDFAAAAAFGIPFFLVTRHIPFDYRELASDITGYGGKVVESLSELVESRI